MTKKEAKGLGIIVIIGLFISPFVWLYEQIGDLGLGVCAAALIRILIYWFTYNKNKDQKKFDDLVLYVLLNSMQQDEAKKINDILLKNNLNRSALIRNIQIIRDSIEIFLSSKKRDTAESRAELVAKTHQEIKENQASLVSNNIMEKITDVCDDALYEFKTTLFINIANGHVEKASTLKTDKSKIKYLGFAIEVLEEGIRIGSGDISAFKEALIGVKEKQEKHI